MAKKAGSPRMCDPGRWGRWAGNNSKCGCSPPTSNKDISSCRKERWVGGASVIYESRNLKKIEEACLFFLKKQLEDEFEVRCKKLLAKISRNWEKKEVVESRGKGLTKGSKSGGLKVDWPLGGGII